MVSVYLETTIISYITARPSKDLIVAAHQSLTHDWWDKMSANVDCFISPYVVEEIAEGDEKASQKRLEFIENIQLLENNVEIQSLSIKYFEEFQLPLKAKLDASHLASAVWHEMDYLLSWNCTHIVSGRIQTELTRINDQMNLKTPVLCTPEELMEV